MGNQQSTKPLVIYHGADCTDGFGAAFAAWLKFGDEAEYLPIAYGQVKCLGDFYRLVPSQTKGNDVYILDFSFPRETMEQIFRDAKRVVWLDHHKTAFEVYCPMDRDYYKDDENGHHILLDNNKSGALLAWEYFHPNTEVPTLFRHIDDYDRWQFKIEGSKEIHAVLASMKPWNFEQWDSIVYLAGYEDSAGLEGLPALLVEGSAILCAQDAAVISMAKQARKCCISVIANKPGLEKPWLPGYEQRSNDADYEAHGLAVNASIYMSELGHELANRSGTYGMIWYVGEDNKVKVSLRSNGDYDVSAIAKVFGGGGHRNAASFFVDVQTLLGWLL